MRLLRAATLTTPDPDAAMARYANWLDYGLVERGTVDEDLAAAWGAPAAAGRRYVIGRPSSGADVFLRFVEGTPPADYRPLRSYGWAAIEICVQDTDTVHDRLRPSPFEIIGAPRQLDGMPEIYPMQVKGPDGEIVFLTQIKAQLASCDLPMAESPIDRLFIIVLACSGIERSIAWFEQTLGFTSSDAVAIAYRVLSDAFGLPRDHKHVIAIGLHGRDCFLEFDQYPAAATVRPLVPGALPPGVAIATFHHPSLRSVRGDWISPPRPRAGALYGGALIGTLRAPDDTLVELVEIPS